MRIQACSSLLSRARSSHDRAVFASPTFRTVAAVRINHVHTRTIILTRCRAAFVNVRAAFFIGPARQAITYIAVDEVSAFAIALTWSRGTLVNFNVTMLSYLSNYAVT